MLHINLVKQIVIMGMVFADKVDTFYARYIDSKASWAYSIAKFVLVVTDDFRL